MIKEGNLEYQEERKKRKIKKIGFPSPLGFSKLCLMVETKVITLSNVVLKPNYDDKHCLWKLYYNAQHVPSRKNGNPLFFKEGNEKSSRGRNHGELMCKTWDWLNFIKLLTALPALVNSTITIGLGHFINSPEGQKCAPCSKEYRA